MPTRRAIFLVNRPFQLRFAFYVCSFLFALSFAYPLILSNSYEFFMKYLAGDPSGPPIAYIEEARKELLSLIMLMEGVFLLFAFIISLFLSHRIAGPIYKLRMFLQAAKTGNLETRLSFRKNDYFKEVAEDYNNLIKTMSAIQRTSQRNAIAMQNVLPVLEAGLKKTGTDARMDIESAIKILKDAQKI